jgi:hypothetical protein
MNQMTKSLWKQYVEQWKRAGPELERIRREELKGLKYDFPAVDSLLEIGDRFGQSRPTSGLVEMQKWFMMLAERQGLVSGTAREEPAPYGSKRRRKILKTNKIEGGRNRAGSPPK